MKAEEFLELRYPSGGSPFNRFELIVGYRALTIQRVSNFLCSFFDPDNNTSSATKCKHCGREKWEHPNGTKLALQDPVSHDLYDCLKELKFGRTMDDQEIIQGFMNSLKADKLLNKD